MAARAAGLGLVLSGSLIGLLTTAAYLHLGVSEVVVGIDEIIPY